MTKAIIRLAVMPDAEELSRIEREFDAAYGKQLSYEAVADPSLIGGFVITVGERSYKVYDASIKSRLKEMREALSGRHDEALVTHAEQVSGPATPMPDLGDMFDPRLFRAEAEKIINKYVPVGKIGNVGRITRVGDGVLYADGLEHCQYGELLTCEGGAQAIALDLELGRVGAVLLTGQNDVSEGAEIRNTDNVLRVPVGDALLGRVIDPLGAPIDGKGAIAASGFREIEAEAPPIMQRKKVSEPLDTGILSVDSMIPIGRGQRELIIGDRQTGKTALAVDTILNQKGKGVYCIYVAIGQKASTIADIVHTLSENGAMEHTVIVAATASDSAPMQYIAPYAGCAVAEEFMYSGRHALIVYDDLSKHAVAYRAMSLLLRRPPGREAYPGDVFYLHSRLLERAAKLSGEMGGGSMTAMPIIETMAGDISAYIPTNVISITDGQIFLESELFNAGMRPAVNVGLSVSRVGGSAQTKAMRKVSGKLRLDLAQYRELAVFAQFASDLDPATQDQINNGMRVTDSLIQKQFAPMTMAEQVVLLSMITRRKLLGVPLKRIAEFNEGFLHYVEANAPQIKTDISMSGQLSDENFEKLSQLADAYKEAFLGKAPQKAGARA